MRLLRKSGAFLPDIEKGDLAKAEYSLFRERFDAGMRMEKGDKWVTINGSHILISPDGTIKTPTGKGKNIKDFGKEAVKKSENKTKDKGDAASSPTENGSTDVDASETPSKTYVPATDDDIKAAETKAWERYQNMDDDTTFALESYVEDYHVNQVLRIAALGEKVEPYKKEEAQRMQAVLEASPLEKDMTLYRITTEDEFSDITVGKKVHQPGFMSTSMRKEVDDTYFLTYATNSAPVYVEIKAPKGTPGMYLSGIHEAVGANFNQKEMCLGAGLLMKIAEDKGNVALSNFMKAPNTKIWDNKTREVREASQMQVRHIVVEIEDKGGLPWE